MVRAPASTAAYVRVIKADHELLHGQPGAGHRAPPPPADIDGTGTSHGRRADHATRLPVSLLIAPTTPHGRLPARACSSRARDAAEDRSEGPPEGGKNRLAPVAAISRDILTEGASVSTRRTRPRSSHPPQRSASTQCMPHPRHPGGLRSAPGRVQAQRTPSACFHQQTGGAARCRRRSRRRDPRGRISHLDQKLRTGERRPKSLKITDP